MHLICLTPTYGRPTLAANALALYLAQQLRSGDTAHMLIFDDAGQISAQSGGQSPQTWEVMSQATWIPLTEKYAPMLEHVPPTSSQSTAYVVWDDDDVYLPWHLAAHATVLQSSLWSHPTRAWSTYGTDPLTEAPNEKQLSGRHYHGALAVRGDLMTLLGGWPKTDRSNYDKQMLAACRSAAGPPGDPCAAPWVFPPSYIYRWGDTLRDHCSARIQGGRYQRPRVQEPGHVDHLAPKFDASTTALLKRLAR